MSRDVKMASILLLSLLVTWSGAIFDSQRQAAIDQVMETGMQCRNIPGLSVAVVKDGQVGSLKLQIELIRLTVSFGGGRRHTFVVIFRKKGRLALIPPI